MRHRLRTQALTDDHHWLSLKENKTKKRIKAKLKWMLKVIEQIADESLLPKSNSRTMHIAHHIWRKTKKNLEHYPVSLGLVSWYLLSMFTLKLIKLHIWHIEPNDGARWNNKKERERERERKSYN